MLSSMAAIWICEERHMEKHNLMYQEGYNIDLPSISGYG